MQMLNSYDFNFIARPAPPPTHTPKNKIFILLMVNIRMMHYLSAFLDSKASTYSALNNINRFKILKICEF